MTETGTHRRTAPSGGEQKTTPEPPPGRSEASSPHATPGEPDKPTPALVQGLVAATATILAIDLAVATGTAKTVAIIVALIAMIMLHEFGHYITARWGGMKVTEFFVGFGPRLWSVRRGETEYGVKAIPAGGYVKIIGMNNLEKVDPEDEPRTYRQQSFPRRLAVAVAGSTMHFLIAFVLLWVVHSVIGVPRASLEIGSISTLQSGPSPAQAAGFQLGDRIVSIDGQPVRSWQDVPEYIQDRPGQEVRFVVQRGDQLVELVARPLDLSQVQLDGMPVTERPTGFVGIGPEPEFERADPLSAVVTSARGVAVGVVEVTKALAKIFSPGGVKAYVAVLTGNPPPGSGPGGADTRFLSPVGFTRLAAQAADTGLFQVMQLLIAINLFVGLFNLLPLLPLDGGHVAIATYEAIRSRISGRRHQVDVAKLMPATYLVFFILVFLGLSALYLDIVEPLTNPFR